jgi:hypothetical protein
MKLKNLYSKSIDRHINSAVVVSLQDEETVRTEISEYVFTEELIDNLYRFLNDMITKRNTKTSVWISGYYGSGKSHFIKYVYYCLNKETTDLAFDHFIDNADLADPFSDATPSNIKILKNKISDYEIDTIIFNIDAVSGQKNEREKITKIFLNQFNDFRGYNPTNIGLALLLEKHLDEIGAFENFKTAIQSKYKKDWKNAATTLISLKQSDVLAIAQKYDSSIDIESLKAKLKNPDDITIKDTLIPEFKDFLSQKPDNYRLVFMLDEVSQYIGSNTNLLLSLQTIVEEVSAECDNKIWLACTAQQTLDQIVQNTEISGEDFGKILGRFETRISLQSQDAAYITQKRILEKNSEGTRELTNFYTANKDTIENQYVFNHELYTSYNTKDEFLLAYPFLPYQFRLIADVFDSFSNINYVVKEVKDNERSVLGITHSLAKQKSNEEIGYFIPFDAFLNDLFKTNLTHHAQGVIGRAIGLDAIKSDPFAQRVVNVLFMVANLSDTKRITFPANLDNLTLLLMDQPDVNKLELQNKIDKVLDVLIKNSIISREDDNYRFYKEDEIEVANLVQSQQVIGEERVTVLSDIILENILSVNKRISFGNNNFNLSLAIDDKEIFKGGEFNVLISAFDNTSVADKALRTNKNDLVVCINDWFFRDDSLKNEIQLYTKTKKYIRLNSDSATGTRKKTIEMFGEKNRIRKNELIDSIRNKFSETPFISGTQIISPADISGKEPRQRFNTVLERHLSEIYKKNKLAKPYTNEELKRKAMSSRQTNVDKSLSPAEDIINSFIDNTGMQTTVDDVIKHFLKPPFGWKDTSTLGLLLELGIKHKRQFEWRSEAIDFNAFVDYALKTNERSAIIIREIKNIDKTLVNDVMQSYGQIFNEHLAEQPDPFSLYEDIKKKLKLKETKFASYKEDYYGVTPFGKHFHDMGTILKEWLDIREPKILFEKIIEQENECKSLNDACKDVIEFIEHQYSNYKVIYDYMRKNSSNIASLELSEKEKADTLKDYLAKEDKPGDRFPQMKRIYEEIRTSLKDKSNNLQKEARSAYADIFDELDKKASELKVTDVSGFYDKQAILNAIDRESNLTQLQLRNANAPTFKTDVIEQLIKASQKDTGAKKEVERFDIKATHIESEEQLDVHLNWLRGELMKRLKENKIILLVKE